MCKMVILLQHTAPVIKAGDPGVLFIVFIPGVTVLASMLCIYIFSCVTVSLSLHSARWHSDQKITACQNKYMMDTHAHDTISCTGTHTMTVGCMSRVTEQKIARWHSDQNIRIFNMIP